MKYFTTLIICLLLVSCNKQGQKRDHSNQRELFKQSLIAIDKYKAKILKSENLTELDSLFTSFEEELGNINMKFPAKTDFDMAENENDTLSSRILEIIQIRDSIRQKLVIHKLPGDSTVIAEESHPAIRAVEL